MKLLNIFMLFMALCAFQTTRAQEDAENDAANEVEAESKTKNKNVKPVNAPPSENVGYLPQAIGVGLGQTVLFGDYSHHGDDGLALDLFYQYRASYSFDFLANYHSTTYKKNDGQKVDLTGLTFNIKGRMFDYDAFAPYITGGLGLYWPKATRIQGAGLQGSEKHMVIGVNAGVGADLQINENVSFGLAGFYHNPFRVKQDSQASLVGSYFRLMLTAFLHF